MLYFVLYLWFVELCVCQLSTNKDELLNWCLDAKHHKKQPGKESALYNQCLPWKDHACCTENTTYNIHTTNMYNFDYNHCYSKIQKNMSESCREHFLQDLCFYECEPHIGLWVVQTTRKIAKERFLNVPLCASDCNTWWDACKYDYTCAYNWPLNFQFVKGRNMCRDGANCLRFTEVYKNASDFCENVWDHSWKIVPDNEPCMRIWFNGTAGNPNKAVAKYYIDKAINKGLTLTSTNLLIAIIVLVLVYN